MDYRIVVSFAIALLIDVAFPIIVTLWFSRRYGSTWRLWLCGVLIFVLFQLITRVPIMIYLGVIVGPIIAESTVLAVGWIAVAAVTAGLVEEIGRWLGYRYLFHRVRAEHNWANGVMYGLGHGGIESIVLVGGLVLSNLLSYVFISRLDLSQMSALLSPDQAEAMLVALEQFQTMSPWMPLLGGLERILTLPIQVCLSLLVLQGFVRRERRWLWLAILAHTVVNFVAALVASGGNLVVAELVIAMFGAVALGGILRLRKWEGSRAAGEDEPHSSLSLGDSSLRSE